MFNPDSGAKCAKRVGADLRVLVSAAAKFHCATFYNDQGSDMYILVFDASAEVSDGTVPTVPPFPVPAGSWGSLDYGASGRPVNSGVAVYISSTALTLTAVGANNGTLDVTYS